MKFDVLDKGFIEVVDSLGNDLTVVNSARVSFGKRKSVWSAADRRLVKYLAKYKHYSPFRHLQVQFHVKAPEFVMRQWYKHVVGIETTSKSSAKHHWEMAMFHAKEQYQYLLQMGVGKEQARAILPLNQYTEVYWTASFQAIMNFIELRNEKTSQWEIQEYAKVLLECMYGTFPKITEIWAEAHGWE